jgi:histidyl-tRNA synthetase
VTEQITRVKPQILKGFRDYLPDAMILRQRIISTFRTIFERHGFEPLDTPAIEYLEILTGKAGENERLMYRFQDHGGRDVGLRYDLTVPLARVAAMHQNELVVPFKRYHIAPVWRAEKPQRGRFREFWQCDADVVGSPSMLADAESVAITVKALDAVGLPGFRIRINHRQLLASLARWAGVGQQQAGSVYRAIDKLDKIGREGVEKLLVEGDVDKTSANRLLDLITGAESFRSTLARLRDDLSGDAAALAAVDDLTEMVDGIEALGVSADRYSLDLSLARGLDYYTGPVFEAVVERPLVGSLVGAGRYDGLIGSFSGRAVPATGLSLGIERIIEVVREHDLLATPTTVADVFVAHFPETASHAATVATKLRAAGFNCDLSLLTRRSLGEQMKYADRKGIPVGVVVGTAEVASETVLIRDLKSGTERSVPSAELASRIGASLTNKETDLSFSRGE